jgi:hypothetical protein
MREPEESTGGGWTVWKVIGFVVGLFGMIGFGLCSLCGLVSLQTAGELHGVILVFAIPGLILAYLCSAEKPPP